MNKLVRTKIQRKKAWSKWFNEVWQLAYILGAEGRRFYSNNL